VWSRPQRFFAVRPDHFCPRFQNGRAGGLGWHTVCTQDFAGAITYYNKSMSLVNWRRRFLSVVIQTCRQLLQYRRFQSEHWRILTFFWNSIPKLSQGKLLKGIYLPGLDDEENQLQSLEDAMQMQPPNPDLLKWRGCSIFRRRVWKDQTWYACRSIFFRMILKLKLI